MRRRGAVVRAPGRIRLHGELFAASGYLAPARTRVVLCSTDASELLLSDSTVIVPTDTAVWWSTGTSAKMSSAKMSAEMSAETSGPDVG
jgi:hypothetical protein